MTVSDNRAPRILFVDDEEIAVKYFHLAIDTVAPVITANSVDEGKRLLDEHAQTLLVLVSDQRMPGGYGNDLLQYARLRYPHMERILTTAFSELEFTIEAVNQGRIHRYIHKPWEISTLRVELKQSLDFASLRKEHDLLLREKLMVRQKQLLTNRLATLHTLCASLLSPDDFSPMQAYLAAAFAAGLKPLESDMQDYAALISVEARRGGDFGHALYIRLDEIKQQHKDWQASQGLGILAELLGDTVQVNDQGVAQFTDAQFFTEFLQAPSDTAISAAHISWLAFLIFLQESNCSVQLSKLDSGMQCELQQATQPVSASQLDSWVEEFCEM